MFKMLLSVTVKKVVEGLYYENMVETKPCMKCCVVFVIIGVLIGGLYMLGKFMTHNHCHRDKPEIPNKHNDDPFTLVVFHFK
jgi:hypothetical protein